MKAPPRKLVSAPRVPHGRVVGLRHLANIFARSHCWAIFLFECHNKNTSGGVRMGVETILLIVILAFAAGFVLDRLAIRRDRFDAAKSKKEL
jgi:hypothetical protein